MVVDSNCDCREYESYYNELNEKVTTLEKSNDELLSKINQREAELKICYVNICLLAVVCVLIIVFNIVKNIRKAK
jgi:hypothetical protein